MRKLLVLLVGIWVLNPFLFMLYIQNRPLYDLFIESGAKMYNCIDWDENGQVITGVCTTPAPEI